MPPRVLYEYKLLLEISQYSKKNTWARVSFLSTVSFNNSVGEVYKEKWITNSRLRMDFLF